MAAVSIRGLDDAVLERLRIRAAQHGRSMGAEMRAILEEAVREPTEALAWAHDLMRRFGALGGVDLETSPRCAEPRSADFA